VTDSIQLNIIGVIHSCFKEKFGTPRQPGLIREAPATLELLPPYNREEAVRGLEGFSHLWVVFLFDQTAGREWKPTVRPPRLGGNRRIGVFASRSNFRPNPIGLSVVELERVECDGASVTLHLRGGDILDGTPILDIKPYLPYADAIPDATAGYAPEPPATDIEVEFCCEAAAFCAEQEQQGVAALRSIIRQMVSADPRPAYRRETEQGERRFGMRLFDYEIKWVVAGARVVVEKVEWSEEGGSQC